MLLLSGVALVADEVVLFATPPADISQRLHDLPVWLRTKEHRHIAQRTLYTGQQKINYEHSLNFFGSTIKIFCISSGIEESPDRETSGEQRISGNLAEQVLETGLSILQKLSLCVPKHFLWRESEGKSRD